MSNANLWLSVNTAESAVALDLHGMCLPQARQNASPIDLFYRNLAALVVLGTDSQLIASPSLGRVLLLGLVSAVELYFRNLISGVLRICPLARLHAQAQMLSFGSLDYYKPADLGLALLENHNFATEGEISKQTKRLLGFFPTKDSSFDAAVAAFEKLCFLRHAAVHSDGVINHKNSRDLGLDSSQSLSLTIDFKGFQDSAAVCQSLVRAYNRATFKLMVHRWIGSRKLSGIWDSDKLLFDPAFKMFYSTQDAAGARNSYAAFISLRPSIMAAIAATATE